MNRSKQDILVAGVFLSLILLIIFFIIRVCNPILLDIDVKWIIVSGIPILLALVIGQFIKTFKGMGLELEMHINSPIINNSAIIETTEHITIKDKAGMDSLYKLSQAEKHEINILSFQQGKKEYYSFEIVRDYLRIIPKISFFVIINTKGKFQYLVDTEA